MSDPFYWKVVPLSPGQLLDVRSEDVLCGGAFRLCDTYRSGGGYDIFPRVAEQRGLGVGLHKQFVVQLRGCTLDCPYCYVTRQGVWGKPLSFMTEQLVEAFRQSGASVFHLMGGAPTLHMKQWPDLIWQLDWQLKSTGAVFHSDLLLTEFPYDLKLLHEINGKRCLYAVNVKGMTLQEHKKNTRKGFDPVRMFGNLSRLEYARVPYYITFTNVSEKSQALFWTMFESLFPWSFDRQVRDASSIDLVDYKALAHVDDVEWGSADWHALKLKVRVP